jgi:hypothetical protein
VKAKRVGAGLRFRATCSIVLRIGSEEFRETVLAMRACGVLVVLGGFYLAWSA